MSFRDNLQHLRATRNMTQEQLAMLLGVSRQSVSKWEAERAYPEMDKLLKLCDMFGCTLDELVTGDLTDRQADVASRMPSGVAPQDVTGYDQMTLTFAWKLPLGVSVVAVGASLALFLSGLILVVSGIDSSTYAVAMVFAGIAGGLAFILPASFERKGFRKAHPFVEDFYTADQKDEARSALQKGLVVGIGLVMVGAVVAIALQSNVWFASSAFFALAAAGVFFILRGCLLGSRCNLTAYNRKSLCRLDDVQIDALDDEELQAQARQAKRVRSTYVAVMCLATAVGLLLLFIPALNAQRWFWLAWPVGGLVCYAIGVFRSTRSGS